jgi:hypothetical protein
MPVVFLSHAASDKALVDDVKNMIQTSVGIAPGEIFYSSGKGTGIPSGANFVDYIKEKMRAATFVVAVITPAYRESEFCLAELGAVWLAADKSFFPLCVPSIDRSALRATLTGIQVERIDDSSALSAMLQRLCAHFDREHNAAACTEAIGVFQATLPGRLDRLTQRSSVPAVELNAAEGTIRDLGERVNVLGDELATERRRFEELKAARSQEEIESISLPEDEVEQVKLLLREAESAVSGLKGIVKKVLPYRAQGNGVGMP